MCKAAMSFTTLVPECCQISTLLHSTSTCILLPCGVSGVVCQLPHNGHCSVGFHPLNTHTRTHTHTHTHTHMHTFSISLHGAYDLPMVHYMCIFMYGCTHTVHCEGCVSVTIFVFKTETCYHLGMHECTVHPWGPLCVYVHVPDRVLE